MTLGGNRTLTLLFGDLTIGGAIGDNGKGYGLTVAGNGNGMLTLAGSNTYSGATIVSGGLNLANQFALQNSTFSGNGASLLLTPA